MRFTIPVVGCLSLLVEHGAAINEPVNEEGDTLLHLAWNNPALAGVLVSYGGNVFKMNSRRVTPLLFSSPAVYRLFEKEARKFVSIVTCRLELADNSYIVILFHCEFTIIVSHDFLLSILSQC